MFRAQDVQASNPLADVQATVGDGIHADAQIGGGDGNVLTANVDLGGINADADVNAGGHGMDSCPGLATDSGAGTGVEVDSHSALGNGVGVDANTGLDGALINAAASFDPVVSGHIDLGTSGDCGCTDTSASAGTGVADVDAHANTPDIGLISPLSLSALDLSGTDLLCSNHA
jgi:hypothetical protein